MGCENSVGREIKVESKDKFSNFELVLGFHNLSSKYIEATFRRFSNESYLDSARLAKAFKVLKLNPQTHKEFYNFFKPLPSSNQYSLNKLSALAVLLGNADDLERAKILFMAYDDSSNGSLESSEVYTMISEIVNISLEYIPKLAVMLSNGNRGLELEASELMRNKTKIVHYLNSKFELTQELVNYERFLNAFNDHEVLRILRPYELRNFASKVKAIPGGIRKASTQMIRSSFS